MSDDVIMSAIEYDRIDRGMTKLTDDLAAATARAERAETEAKRERKAFDDLTWHMNRTIEKLTEKEIALARAVAESGRLRDELRDTRNDLLDVRGILSPNGYEPKTPLPLVPTVAPAVEWLVQAHERAEAAIERVRAVLEERRAGRFWYVRVADVQAVLDSSETPPAATDAVKVIEEHLAKVGYWEFGGTRHVRDALDRARGVAAAPVPEERSDEEPKKRYATGGIVEPGQMYLLGESDGCFIPFPPRRPVDGETT